MGEQYQQSKQSHQTRPVQEEQNASEQECAGQKKEEDFEDEKGRIQKVEGVASDSEDDQSCGHRPFHI